MGLALTSRTTVDTSKEPFSLDLTIRRSIICDVNLLLHPHLLCEPQPGILAALPCITNLPNPKRRMGPFDGIS